MPSPRDQRLEDLRRLRERIRRHPENFAAFLGELHTFLKELYENAAGVSGRADRFAAALADLCGSRGVDRWEEALTPEQRTQFFKDARDTGVSAVLSFWAALDEPLDF